jgi:hypothetical protein
MESDARLPKGARLLVIQEVVETRLAADDIRPFDRDYLDELLHDIATTQANGKNMSMSLLDKLNEVSAAWFDDVEAALEAYGETLTSMQTDASNSIISHLLKK